MKTGMNLMRGGLLLGALAVVSGGLWAQEPGGPPSDSRSFSDEETIKYINQSIEKAWRENGIKPSPPATEHELVRRMYLDLIGRIPSPEEITAHMRGGTTATARQKRTLKVLLEDQDYPSHWANIWTVLLLTRTRQPGIDRANFHAWVADSFANNQRYDQFVLDLLTATGKADDRSSTSRNAPAANFILSHVGEPAPKGPRGEDFGQFEMVPVTSRVTRIFLGIQTQCVQCHDHPFIDTRKQGQYWGVNVFFRQVERQPANITTQNPRLQASQHYELRENSRRNPEGAVFYEKRNGVLFKTGGVYLDGKRVNLRGLSQRRQALAELLVQDPDFGRAIVNRMWAYFMGRGFTDPIDDFGEHNPVSHPDLLDRLAQDFVTSGYDLRRLISWIVQSRPYQLTSMSNETNRKPDTDAYFARVQLKAMSPEQLVDSILQATGADATARTYADKRRLQDEWLDQFVTNFGDDEGNEVTYNGTVVQALMMMNGGRLNEAIRNRAGTTMAKAMTMPPAARIDYLYLAALGRPPSSSERNFITQRLVPNKDDQAAPWQDLFWALLNSNEFILNH
ncbi:MAG TPA: DUF1553 domain-containing protein [Gemmatales bacterium]|nr:DUF1553 domain-containing protein [Gemmatales bacterium]HMP60736.1 DUF1553 domain-containing protein [Gemmatales bacterium]